MKISEILLEDGKEFRPKKQVQYDDLKKIISKMNPDVLNAIAGEEKNKNFIYRGTYSKSGYQFFQQSSINLERPRHSANTSNEYNLLVSEILKSWKKYPQRNQSFICSTDLGAAQNFGDVFYIFPIGNPDIGVCSEGDFWNSFPEFHKYLDSMEEFNSMIQQMLEDTLFDSSHTAVRSSEDLVKILRKAQNSIMQNYNVFMKKLDDDQEKEINKYGSEASRASMSKYIKKEKDFYRRIYRETAKHKDIIYVLNELLDPTTNKFKIMKFADIVNAGKSYGDREVWFEGDALFIDIDAFLEFKKMVEEELNKGGK